MNLYAGYILNITWGQGHGTYFRSRSCLLITFSLFFPQSTEHKKIEIPEKSQIVFDFKSISHLFTKNL